MPRTHHAPEPAGTTAEPLTGERLLTLTTNLASALAAIGTPEAVAAIDGLAEAGERLAAALNHATAIITAALPTSH